MFAISEEVSISSTYLGAGSLTIWKEGTRLLCSLGVAEREEKSVLDRITSSAGLAEQSTLCFVGGNGPCRSLGLHQDLTVGRWVR